MRVAYLVSRFPAVSESFVVRELAAVAAEPGVEVELHALFPPHRESTVHPLAQEWLPRLQRPAVGEGLAALAWWGARRPARLLWSVAHVGWGYARRPRMLARALATLPLAAAQARRMRASEITHVHAHFATYPALAAWLIGRLTGISYSFTPHAHDLFIHQSMLARKQSDASFVVAISEFNRDFLRTHGGASAAIHVIHCGVEPRDYAFGPAEPPPPDAPVRALCVAALREYKGHAVLLRALHDAGSELGRVELDLVGDGELREQLERLVQELGLSARVRFHGNLPAPEVTEMLARSHLFVLPSIIAADGDMEGLPVALMEALAAGVPAISTSQSGIPELLRDGVTGTLAEPGDVGDLRRALVAVLADPAAARERALAGRRLIEAEFDVSSSARRLVVLFGRDRG